MSSHTPGPWSVVTVRTSKKVGPRVDVVAGALRNVIAAVTIPRFIHEWNNSPFHANAQLIAAAPQMLAALEAVRREGPAALQDVERAIEAATGEQAWRIEKSELPTDPNLVDLPRQSRWLLPTTPRRRATG